MNLALLVILAVAVSSSAIPYRRRGLGLGGFDSKRQDARGLHGELSPFGQPEAVNDAISPDEAVNEMGMGIAAREFRELTMKNDVPFGLVTDGVVTDGISPEVAETRGLGLYI